MSGHERSDMNPTYAFYFLAALAVLGIAIHIGLWWMLQQLEQMQARHETPRTLVTVDTPKPQPPLQISPQGDLEKLRREEDEILRGYRWVDRGKGTAGIPIERAMEIVVEKGR